MRPARPGQHQPDSRRTCTATLSACEPRRSDTGHPRRRIAGVSAASWRFATSTPSWHGAVATRRLGGTSAPSSTPSRSTTGPERPPRLRAAWQDSRTGFPIVGTPACGGAPDRVVPSRVRRMIAASFLVRTCTCPGGGGAVVSWTSWSTATSPAQAAAAGGGRPAAAPTRRRTSGCSARRHRTTESSTNGVCIAALDPRSWTARSTPSRSFGHGRERAEDVAPIPADPAEPRTIRVCQNVSHGRAPEVDRCDGVGEAEVPVGQVGLEQDQPPQLARRRVVHHRALRLLLHAATATTSAKVGDTSS